jgi:hypothetical protein|tara:strand:+ start:445 stop:597 length:153 start_codon:yes stop_codon:yes gene_type:complete
VSNNFLIILGVIFFLIGRETGGVFPSFMFGLCFGIIYLNYKRDKKENNEK